MAVCLLEGWDFRPSERVHLNYIVSMPVPLAVDTHAAGRMGRSVTTPLPLVTCLMRKHGICRYVQTDRRGHFGPVWLRFTYLLGDRDQGFEVRAYGGPSDQASIVLPSVRVVE